MNTWPRDGQKVLLNFCAEPVSYRVRRGTLEIDRLSCSRCGLEGEGQLAKSSKLGTILKAIRSTRGWTLAEVSTKTGISASTISKIERGELSPTYDKIVQLAKGMSVDVTQLFHSAPPPPHAPSKTRRSVSTGDDGDVVDTPTYRYLYLNGDLLNKKFMPIIAELHARSIEEFGPLVVHDGEEFTYVLEGEVEFHCAHYAPVLLKRGDRVYFDATMGHAYIAAGAGPVRILCIASAPDAPGNFPSVSRSVPVGTTHDLRKRRTISK